MSASPAPGPALRRPLVLVGMRAVGKTTVARRVAERLGVPCVDLDAKVLELARFEGRPAASAGELLEQVGQHHFRELEAVVLRQLLEPQPALVLAAGGGAVENADARAWIQRTSDCVWLQASPAALSERLRGDPTHRPALMGGDPAAELAELAARRAPLYAQVATHVVATDGRAPDEVAGEVLALVAPSPASVSR